MNNAAEIGDRTPWSSELEELHEESSRNHFLDVATRVAILGSLGEPPTGSRILDIGCSSGYLLEDLCALRDKPSAVGVDYVFAGLRVAQKNLPTVRLLQGDACRLPFADSTIDAIVSANLLEHVPSDVEALGEMRRVLKPGSRAVLVVPAGAGLYDYYDHFLHHQRRYGRDELPTKAVAAGLEVVDQFYLGWLVYPMFWFVKKRNRIFRGRLSAQEARRQVEKDISTSSNSWLGRRAQQVETYLRSMGLSAPFGIRQAVTVRRPAA